jgi:hypothetical protein
LIRSLEMDDEGTVKVVEDVIELDIYWGGNRTDGLVAGYVDRPQVEWGQIEFPVTFFGSGMVSCHYKHRNEQQQHFQWLIDLFHFFSINLDTI